MARTDRLLSLMSSEPVANFASHMEARLVRDVLYAIQAVIEDKMKKKGKSLDDLSFKENKREDENKIYLQFEWRHYYIRLNPHTEPTLFFTVTRTDSLSLDIRFANGPVTTIRRNRQEWWQEDPWIYVSRKGWSDRLAETIDPELFDRKLRELICLSFER